MANPDNTKRIFIFATALDSTKAAETLHDLEADQWLVISQSYNGSDGKMWYTLRNQRSI